MVARRTLVRRDAATPRSGLWIGAMNVCLISREYPPFFGGGIGTYAERYAWTLANRGHRAVVITVSTDGEEHREVLSSEGPGSVVVVRLPFIRGNDWSKPDPAIAAREHERLFRTHHPVSLFAKLAADALTALIREFGIESIEAPDTGALGWFALDRKRRGARELRDVPIVTMVHSPSAWVAQWNRESVESGPERALTRMEAEQARWSDALVCPSRALASWAENLWELPTGTIEVIPYPLGPLEDIARARVRQPAGPSVARGEGPTRIVFAGRLEPRKGVDTLLRGAAIALDRGALLEIDLFGQDMPHPEHRGERFGAWCLREHVPEKHRTRIRLLGRVPPGPLAKAVERADVAVIPSPMDNFPITCMEAMSAGRAVLAARAGGMAEMIEDGVSGLLFEPGDAESCALALARVADMPRVDLARLGDGAALRMLRMCGNEEILARRLAHYEVARASRAVDPAVRSGALVRALRRARAALRL